MLTKKAIEERRKYQQKWRERNREHLRNYYKKYREENPEKVRKYQENYWNRKASGV